MEAVFVAEFADNGNLPSDVSALEHPGDDNNSLMSATLVTSLYYFLCVWNGSSTLPLQQTF